MDVVADVIVFSGLVNILNVLWKADIQQEKYKMTNRHKRQATFPYANSKITSNKGRRAPDIERMGLGQSLNTFDCFLPVYLYCVPIVLF